MIASTSSSDALHFVGEGFRHIVPDGLDHILFVLGLFFLARSIPPLVWQLTTFTLGHSLTLGLSVQGIVRLPQQAIEIAIGLSIALVGLENLCTERLTRWRPAWVFCFGLIHGLGFAHSFHTLAGSAVQSLPALIGFNFGIECGQLALLAAAFLLLGWTWEKPWTRRRIALPASTLIFIAGLWLSFTRWL